MILDGLFADIHLCRDLFVGHALSDKRHHVLFTLGEIQRLAPGALVPLARPFDEPLDIMANGKRLGRGTLVRIGQSLGVRIVSLVGND